MRWATAWCFHNHRMCFIRIRTSFSIGKHCTIITRKHFIDQRCHNHLIDVRLLWIRTKNAIECKLFWTIVYLFQFISMEFSWNRRKIQLKQIFTCIERIFEYFLLVFFRSFCFDRINLTQYNLFHIKRWTLLRILLIMFLFSDTCNRYIFCFEYKKKIWHVIFNEQIWWDFMR